MNEYTICALYKFVKIEDCAELRESILNFLLKYNIKGTLLIASEGINGTIAGQEQDIIKALDFLNSDKRLNPISYKISYHKNNPFLRTKVKLKNEIVTLGVKEVDPNKKVGKYVDAKDWNDLISEDDVTLIDTRNNYEVRIGTFKNSVNPNTKSFREFPKFVKNNLKSQKK